jgi:predicted nucleotidyltransferase
MAVSIDNYLRTLSYSYYLKNDSTEVEKINKSIDNLFLNLQNYFGLRVKRNFVFGSYDRDTILPRSIDEKSDVDIMIVFNHTEYERTPATYRTWLKEFADFHYKNRYGSEVVKTSPTITIRLSNINYDLVPANENEGPYTARAIYIPANDITWRETKPDDVKDALTSANKTYNGVVRLIIRLLKAWNCTHGYPYENYLLERELVGKNYSNYNCETGFFYAIDNLIDFRSSSNFKRNQIDSLRYNIGSVKYCLQNNELDNAKRWLHRVLP